MGHDIELHRVFNRGNLNDRAINELLGISRGVIADGMVNYQEALYVQKWLAANLANIENPIVNNLLLRIDEMLRDDHLSDDEARELMDTLERFSGGDFELGEVQKSTSIPFNDPPPVVEYPDKRFCFTGTFAYGSRRDCEKAVEERGGKPGKLAKSSDFLVIGIYATSSWAHSSYGRKIENAINWRTANVPIAIISEQHWLESLAD